MRLITLLFAATANAFLLNCNGGTAGDGGCEANGLHTYCCNESFETPIYVNVRDVTVLSKNPQGNSDCRPTGTNTVGRVYCAA
ncbi:uncharacterized protein CCOS01_11127 [Colletotrichum costaricense]|uniref:Uncharacterized protein n=2 Tax=Colletotrichum acutatum species complex TaxID=2707335 RepID=A0AAJ0DXT0_9PEZI|nr:uncharacterized protein CCOS01_11127 [Colletotrichum costaricense]XP_060381321.1 uncharacterized protein CTAM01_08134 [Colletotrichum tamarilloi]KAK1497122.1 hypothetical protein CTAM01_08134 [Colletotrichum tamarilloi]KAK1519476.1 hypothetical protein CCOS01_11127 [Colletotrichum costaricense]